MVLKKLSDISSNSALPNPAPQRASCSLATMTSGAGSAHDTQPDRSASPVGSLYAMSDDEEGEYNTITHTETGKGVKLLFSKSKVRPLRFHSLVSGNHKLTLRCI